MKRVTIIKDQVSGVIGSINELLGKQVLVGIPETNADRTGDNDEPITNAALGYIHEFGAPGANIPARPFLVPGVRKAEKEVLPHLRAAYQAALDGRNTKPDKELVAAGLIAEGFVKREITTGNFAPLKPGTVAGRARSRGSKTQRAAEKEYLRLVGAGASPAAAQVAAGIRPLVNTGQLRAAITSVVRKNPAKKLSLGQKISNIIEAVEDVLEKDIPE